MEDIKVFIKDVRSINRLVVAVVVALLSPVNPNLFFFRRSFFCRKQLS